MERSFGAADAVTVRIIGNKIHCFPSFQSLFAYVSADLEKGGSLGYITVNNVHTMMEGYLNKEYRQIIHNSYLAVPDGKPLEIVGKLKGVKNISRLFGPDLMEYFIDAGRSSGKKHFFIGSSEETLDALKAAIATTYPGTQVAGTIAPPFAPMQEWSNQAYIDQINKAEADFVWVGLGAPKQEKWMHEFAGHLNKGVMVGIGAGFDYMAGRTKHAPRWMKNASLEWFYRLVQEPKRLWKRYFLTIPPFLLLAFFDVVSSRFRNI